MPTRCALTAVVALCMCSFLSGCSQEPLDPGAVNDHSRDINKTQSQRTNFVTQSDPVENVLPPSAARVPNRSQTVDGVLTPSVVHPDQFIADDDVFALVARPTELAESSSLSRLLDHFVSNENVGMDSTHMDWVSVSGTEGALETGHEMENITIAVHTLEVVSPAELLSARFPDASLDSVTRDGVSYIRLTGVTNESLEMVKAQDGTTSAVTRVHSVPAMALYHQDDQTFVFCAESRLETVLQAGSGHYLRSLLNSYDSEAPVMAAVSGLARRQNSSGTASLLMPQLATVQRSADAVVVQFQPDTTNLLDARVYVTSGRRVSGLFDAMRNCHDRTCERISSIAELAPPELKPIMQSLHELLIDAEFANHSDFVQLTLSSQESFSRLCESVADILQPRVAVR